MDYSRIQCLMHENNDLRDQIRKLRAQRSASDARAAAALRQISCGKLQSHQHQQEIKGLKEKHAAEVREIQEANKKLPKDSKEYEDQIEKLNRLVKVNMATICGLRRQMESLNVELANRDQHTNKEKSDHDEEDDDSVYSEDSQVSSDTADEPASSATSSSDDGSQQLREAQRPGDAVSTAGAKKSSGTEHGANVQSKKRRLEDEQDLELVTKRFKAVSIEAHALRLIRQARQVGEKRRSYQQAATKQWTFQIVTSYLPSQKVTFDSGSCARLFSTTWKSLANQIDSLKNDWEKDGEDLAWFQDSSFTSAKMRICVNSKMNNKDTRWRPQDDGLYACDGCARSKLPCFTFDLKGKRFRLLPLHRHDRTRGIRNNKDVQQWVNA